MERGFLDSGSKKKRGVNLGESVLKDLAARVKNIDGKLIGKDGKPLRVLRKVYGLHHADESAVKDVDSDHGMNKGENLRSLPHNPTDVPLKPILKHGKTKEDVISSPKVRFSTQVTSTPDCHDQEAKIRQADLNQFTTSPHGLSYGDNNNQSGLSSNADLEQPRTHSYTQDSVPNDSTIKSGSFADKLKETQPNAKKIVKISYITSFEEVSGADVAIPKSVVDDVRMHFSNTLYGYFLGKRVAFPIVEKYVMNTWAKYGIERAVMRNGFYLFKFTTKEGMQRVLENGPWTIRLSPIILNVWKSNTKLEKEEVSIIPVWVKLQKVPIVAYSDVGLSHISSKLGKPIMFDSYTCDMCLNPWGRSTYARVLIEMSADRVFKESLVVAIPLEDGMGHSMETIEVEYEWKPPHCTECKSFGHNLHVCPKRVSEAIPSTSNGKQNSSSKSAPKLGSNAEKADKDGFIEVTNRRKKGKSKDSPTRIDGIKLTQTKASFYQGTKKPQSKMVYKPKATTSSSGNVKNATPTGNSFNVLSELVDEGNVESQSTNNNVQSEPIIQPVVKENPVVPSIISDKPTTDYYDRSSFGGFDDDMPSTSYNNLECINESDTDDEGDFSSFGGGNQLEEEDLEFSDGYEAQVFDLPGQLKNFRDFKLSMSGRK